MRRFRSEAAMNPQEQGAANAPVKPPEWERAIEACDPASLLVVIASRLGSREVSAEADDILQEALCRAWEARERVEWRGHRAFRAWILTVIDNCISDAARRSAVRREQPLDRPGSWGRERSAASGPPAGSTTPSRLAVYREQAEIIVDALSALDPEVREIIVQRLLMQRELEQIAESMGVGVGAVRHRFRKGCEAYRRELRRSLGHRTTVASHEHGDRG